MVPVAAPRRIKVKASRRALKMLADQAIGNDLMKGFLELITNCDESYARLEARGLLADGRIEIEINRRPRKNQTTIRVIDWAEGMDETQLEKCVGSYGEDTSGQVGRGIFGMGLKDTINAFGEGTIVAFKDGMKHTCVLTNVEDLEIRSPRVISGADKKQFRNASGGTIVEILVQNPKVRIPLVDSLRQQLQMHVCLRGIMSDPSRKVLLRDLRSGSAAELSYKPPDGELLLDSIRLDLPNFPEVTAKLAVRRASGPEALSQSGSDRTGGILITSKRTYHEATLFGFDDDPHASRLFGELRCDGIYDLQATGEPIVDKNRNGLRKDHPLTRELFDAARNKIEEIITAEKEKEKQKQRSLEKEDTLRRFKEAVRNLNQIASKELQVGGAGSGDGPAGEREMRIPVDGFEFVPDTYRIVVAERATLKLRVQVDGATSIAVGDSIEVSCDNPGIKILNPRPLVPVLLCEDPPISVVSIAVEGLQANAQGFVTAKHGSKTAIAAVEVVSTKKQQEHHPRGGLFKDIRYEERADMPVRSRFEKTEGLIWINTLGPSVDLYFGRGGEGQELPANQLLVAELVTEQACREIARVKRDTKTLDIPPGIDELEAYSRHIDKLKETYAPLIHRILVDSIHRRR
jgi:Histidine kinase-, DNA gyrase B-, and HSP90-like ATPase